MTRSLDQVAARIRAAEPFDEADIAVLAESRDILTLGMLGDETRRGRRGTETTFVRVADVQLPLADGERLELPPKAGEVRINGAADRLKALMPDVTRVVLAAGGVPVSAFALEDLEAHALESGRPLADLLAALRDGGVERVAGAALDGLQQAEAALEHLSKSGLGLARLQVLYTASTAARMEHLIRARALQRSLGWIERFAPLGRTWKPGSPSTGFDDVRQVALARLLVDNIASIQVDWSKYGPKLAQVALTVGADDLDAVSPVDESAEGRRRSPLEEVRRNVLAAGLVPVERDGAGRRVIV